MKAPWWFKIGAKIVLSRIPIGYRLFSAVGIFRHGWMQDPAYAIGVFTTHFERANFASKGSQFVGLELGVGDSVASAIVAKAHGASACYLIDSGRFAIEDMSTYKNVVAALRKMGLEVADVVTDTSFEDMLRLYNGVYLANGLASLRTIPDSSVDFVWSQAVLEHVRMHDFDQTMTELFRILSPHGVISHRVDLKDHLGGALNNHRISSETWEAEWMAKSGFYTNRIPYRDMLRRFEKAGFNVEVVNTDRWETLPTPRKKMAPEFLSIADDELLVSGFDVLLRH